MASLFSRSRTIRAALIPELRSSFNFRGSLTRTLYSYRSLKTESIAPVSKTPNFAFAFDIDGVLLRSSKPIARAQKALTYLQSQNIPFILLTNGGGKDESERVADLSKSLGVKLDTSLFVQSHTPFADLVHQGHKGRQPLKDKYILVTGGDGDKCRRVAEKYGFKNVITPGDLYHNDPALWPFSKNFSDYYASHARPLPKKLASATTKDLSQCLKIDAIFVFNDPRDWGLDTQLIMDLLLSNRGYLGTHSPHLRLQEQELQEIDQPQLFFSNSDLWWSAEYHLPRLGQGAFRTALEAVWYNITKSELLSTKIGKPFSDTYRFAEKKLNEHRSALLGNEAKKTKLDTVYMVGDNPMSDIKGALEFKSPQNTNWTPILVRTGVFEGGKPDPEPKVIVDDVWDAVQWALKKSG